MKLVAAFSFILACTWGYGQFFEVSPPGMLNTHFFGLDFINQDTGLVVGDNVILRTHNGGGTWEIVYTAGDEEVYSRIRQVKYLNDTTAFAVGFIYPNGPNSELAVFTTFDGGDSWLVTNKDTMLNASGLSPVPKKIFFFNEQEGLIFCGNGASLKTENGGLDWEIFDAASTGGNYYFFDMNKGFGVSPFGVWDNPGLNGSIFRSLNGGISWWRMVNVEDGLRDIQFTSHYIGYACGENTSAFKTIDEGITWNKLSVVDNGTRLMAIDFLDEHNGYAVGGSDTLISSVIRTNDGGVTWYDVAPAGFTHFLRDVYFPTYQVGYAVGDFGKIIKTENAGGLPNSVVENEIESTVNVYPNPTNGWLNIKHQGLEEIQSVVLLDISGRVMETCEQLNDYIDLGNYEQGMYFLVIYSKNQQSTIRVIKN